MWVTQPCTQSWHIDPYAAGNQHVTQFPQHKSFRSFQRSCLSFPYKPIPALRRLILVEWDLKYLRIHIKQTTRHFYFFIFFKETKLYPEHIFFISPFDRTWNPQSLLLAPHIFLSVCKIVLSTWFKSNCIPCFWPIHICFGQTCKVCSVFSSWQCNTCHSWHCLVCQTCQRVHTMQLLKVFLSACLDFE